jgi:rod shape-determining protein MreC
MLYGLLAVVLMAMDQRGNYVPRFRSAAGSLSEPAYHIIEWPIRAVRNLFIQFQFRRALRHENEKLNIMLLNQKGDLQRLATLEEENRRLRALVDGAQALELGYQFAELVRVDLDPFSHRVLINRGSSDGVTKGQAVIDGAGVMGQVEDVNFHFSTVRLISDPNHALPVQINRTGLRSVALGSGETNTLILNSVPREADVREGDLIVTSGLGERFPSGYPVALVTRIDREEGLTFALIEAAPLAALDRGREVLLIRLPESAPVDPADKEPPTDITAAVVDEQVDAGQVEAGQVEAGQIEAAQIEAAQIEEGQVEEGQVEDGQEPETREPPE